mgnify:CR=1 FL=1
MLYPQGDQLTLKATQLTNSSSVFSAGSLSLQAAVLSNSGSLYATTNQSVAVAGALSNQGTIASGQGLSIQAQSLAGGGVLAAGMSADGKLVGQGMLSVQTQQGLQLSGQALASGQVQLTGSQVNLTGALVGSTGDAVQVKSLAGDVLTRQAQVSAATQLSIQAQGVLDNQQGQLSGKQLQVQAGQLNNQQGSIEQTDSGAQQAELSVQGAVNNQGGRVVANAQNVKLSAGGALDNTGGVIGHAGTGELQLQAGSLDNTRGQVLGNGALERREATGVVVVEHVRVGQAPVLVLQLLPDREREGREVGQALREGLHLQLVGHGLLEQPRTTRRHPPWHRGHRLARRHQTRGRQRPHIGAAAMPAFHEPFGLQAGERAQHGVAGHTKLLGEHAAGGQACAAAQHLHLDGRLDREVELLSQRPVGRLRVGQNGAHLLLKEVGQHLRGALASEHGTAL